MLTEGFDNPRHVGVKREHSFHASTVAREPLLDDGFISLREAVDGHPRATSVLSSPSSRMAGLSQKLLSLCRSRLNPKRPFLVLRRTANLDPVAMRTDDKRRALMLEEARELAGRGHYPLMIEAVLMANGFPEAAEWIHQPHIHKELKDIAERARKKAVGLSTEDRDDAFGVRQ
jgi:hypothetical protein